MMSNKNKLPDVLNVEQLIKLFDAIDRPKVAIASALAFFCGLRISEVCNLKIEDVDLEKQRLKVVDGKNSRRSLSGYGKDRYVPIPPQIISPLKKWLEIIDKGKWFLPSDKSPNSHIRKKSLHEQFRESLNRAGLLIPKYELEYEQKINGKKTLKKATRHKYYFHTLRHSYATYLRDKGIDIYTISDLLGHNQVTTTQIYARISDSQRQRAINQAFNQQFNPYPTNQTSLIQQQNHSPQNEADKLLEIKKLELEIEKIKLSKTN
jgi:integrase/recombinase XerD